MQATSKARDLQAGDQIDYGVIVNNYYIKEVKRSLLVYVSRQQLQTLEVASNCRFDVYNAPAPTITIL